MFYFAAQPTLRSALLFRATPHTPVDLGVGRMVKAIIHGGSYEEEEGGNGGDEQVAGGLRIGIVTEFDAKSLECVV